MGGVGLCGLSSKVPKKFSTSSVSLSSSGRRNRILWSRTGESIADTFFFGDDGDNGVVLGHPLLQLWIWVPFFIMLLENSGWLGIAMGDKRPLGRLTVFVADGAVIATDRVFSKLPRTNDLLAFVIVFSAGGAASSVIAAALAVTTVLGGVFSWQRSCWTAAIVSTVFFLADGGGSVLTFSDVALMIVAALPLAGGTNDRTTSRSDSVFGLACRTTREDGFLLGFTLAFFLLHLDSYFTLSLDALVAARVMLDFVVGAAASALILPIRSLRRQGQQPCFPKAASAAVIREDLFLVIAFFILSVLEMTIMMFVAIVVVDDDEWILCNGHQPKCD